MARGTRSGWHHGRTRSGWHHGPVTGPHFFPEALAEYENAAAYYEMQTPGLGDRLVRMLDEVLALAMEFPLAGKRVEDAPAIYDLRQQVLRVFDIKVIYTVRGNRLIVVAVFHGHAAPATGSIGWRSCAEAAVVARTAGRPGCRTGRRDNVAA
jgi:plasmid stabilization system protein ParE